MKNLLFTLGLTMFTLVPLFSQQNWSSVIPANPGFTASTGNSQIEMYGNRVYQIHDSAGNYVKISVYNPETMIWKRKLTFFSSNFIGNIKTTIVGNTIYAVISGFSGIDVLKYDIATNQMGVVTSGISTVSTSYDYQIISDGNFIYIVYSDNGPSFFLTQVNLSNGATDTQGINTVLNPGFVTGSYKFSMYTSNTKLYIASSNSDSRIGSCPLGTITNFAFYDGVAGQVKKNGAVLTTVNLQFTGDGQTEPYIIVHNPTNNSAYTKLLTTSTVDIQTATEVANILNTSPIDNTALYHPAYGFHISPFSLAGTGSPNDLFYVNRFDNNTLTWDTIGTKIEFGTYQVAQNSLHGSLDNGAKHLSVNYRDVSNNFRFKVLNNNPAMISGSAVTSSGLCIGHENLIYPELQFYDDDNDLLHFTLATSSTGVIQNVRIVPVGIDYTSTPAIQKFAVYADVPSGGIDNVILHVSDGYNTMILNLPNIPFSAGAPTIGFLGNPTVFCNNDNMVNLSEYVNYYDQGSFSINGAPISGINLDAKQLSQTLTSGIIEYNANVNGCLLQTTAPFVIASVASASGSSTASACGANSGTASVTYFAGSYPVASVEWSTGETATTINNLAPGAYYYTIIDTKNCHTTGFASVAASGIALNPTVQNVSCHGANNGSISLNVTGISNPIIVWSNGYTYTQTQNNLAPGSYWVTVSNGSGCSVTESFIITEPAPINATFSVFEPDCGTSNGVVNATFTGGSGTYSSIWNPTNQIGANLINVPHDLYTVTVTDNNNCVKTFSIQLDDYQAIDIKESVTFANCNKFDGAVTVQLTTDPNGGNPPTNWTWSNGTETLNNFNLNAGTYTLTVENGPSVFTGLMCIAQKTFVVGTKGPNLQDICIVTVDSATTTNLVVWERNELDGIDHYVVYRENTLAGLFVELDTVDFYSLSLFNDVIASPMDRSWRYRLSAVNTCGVEGPKSPVHKTLHLNSIVNTGDGSNDIYWDDYEGTQNVNAYVVWRHTDQTGWLPVSPNIPVGTSVYNDLPPAGATGVDYYVEMSLISPCTAIKAQDFNTTRSNRERGQFAPGEGTGESSNGIGENEMIDVNLYPNPITDQLTVVTSTEIPLPLRILSIEGKVILETNTQGSTTLLDFEFLEQGIYIIEITQGNQRIIKQIIKN